MKSSAVRIDVNAWEKEEPMASLRNLGLSRRQQWRMYIYTLIANDLVAMIVAFWLAYKIRFETFLGVFHEEVSPSMDFYLLMLLASALLALIIFACLGLYHSYNLLGGTGEYSLVFRGTAYSMLFVIVVSFIFPELQIARGWLLLFWLFTFLLVGFGRFILRRAVYAMRWRNLFMSPAIIVGANDEGLLLARQLMEWKSSGLAVVGFVDKKLPVGKVLPGKLKVLGRVEDLGRLVEQLGIEEIILASSAISSRDKLLDIFQRYGVNDKVTMRMSSGLYEIVTTGLTVKEFGCVPLVGVNKTRHAGIDSILKFMIDIGLTIPGLILTAPFLLLIALWVKLDSPGPVFHKRHVMGMNGREFDAYKFRTMYVNGDEILAQNPELYAEYLKNHKLKDDPRVTRAGRFLRKLSLDELPQLFNVFKREMSLVGPRMICPDEMDNYNTWGINLLTVRPGITGLWQVSGRSDVVYEERVKLDMYYIRNWSIWLDLHLLWQTVPAVLKGRGAY